MVMTPLTILPLWFAVVVAQESGGIVVEQVNSVEATSDGLDNTEPLLVFVVFRHGDRTPDQEEIDLYPSGVPENKDTFFPYGKKALTNKGKQRAFVLGEYLRKRYDDLVSDLYIADELEVRTTDYARTKMTALTVLAALYPPQPPQKWNPALDWQPIPYDTLPFDDDDLLYWYNCPRYMVLRNRAYKRPEVAIRINKYRELYQYLSHNTGQNITTPEDVFNLDNLFQTLNNVGVRTPKWAEEVMDQIHEVTKLEYNVEFYDDDLIKLSSGVLMADFINATASLIAGVSDQPVLRLYSAHENNVAGFLAAARVFKPHQPRYGAAFSLELRKNTANGQYGIAAIYSPSPGEPERVLPIEGCGGRALCDFDTFLRLTQDVVLTRNEFNRICPK